MTIGELISALSLHCSEEDELLLMKSIMTIEVRSSASGDTEVIDLYFQDANTADKTINKQGEFLHYNS